MRQRRAQPVEVATWREVVSVTQSLGHSAHVEGKRHNLSRALEHLRALYLAPGALFSFWHQVGPPSRHRGFVPGRNVVRGHLREDDGGGLCQLSGLLYLLALQAGLRLVERHNHSVDLYTDATRYTPLGADATVVYGYKDLRFVNTQPCPLLLDFTLGEHALTGSLRAPLDLKPWTLEFTVREEDAFRHVTTWRRPPGAPTPERLHEARYRRFSEG